MYVEEVRSIERVMHVIGVVRKTLCEKTQWEKVIREKTLPCMNMRYACMNYADDLFWRFCREDVGLRVFVDLRFEVVTFIGFP